jgi:methylglutaconyl-CoA hydratase
VAEPIVLFSEEGGICTLTFNRDEAANALSLQLMGELDEQLALLRYRDDVRVVIITGKGTRAFCAGADLKERKGMDDAAVRKTVDRIRGIVEGIAKLPMPVIAAINGVAFGGGTEIALAADLRVMSEHARIGLTETSLGIIPGAGGTQRLPRLIGPGKARQLIYTARRIEAKEALSIGLVDEICDSGSLQDVVYHLAREIAKNGPVAVRAAKFAISEGMNVDLETGLKIERVAYEKVIPTVDRLEGLRAFAEKRPPKYVGR